MSNATRKPRNVRVDPTVRPRVYRIGSVARATGLSPSQIHRLSESDPDFPKPVRLTARTFGWSAEEVDRWIDERLAAA